ncbi:MAG: SPFH domain-containing protein, partial [Clostridia bacterium]|nr:SPFH domain-containing protein [Clostridia bacterium]
MAREIELISYESNNQELVGKINIEDLKTKSNIIVNESQEALFYKDGQALDLFTAGRHELKTDSLPIFKRIFKSLFGTNSPLPCTVYFINKVNVLDMNWGTPSPITLEDPKYHLIVNVGANGSMGVKIADSRKFVIKVMGQINSVSVDDIKRSIKGVMVANIKDCISNVIIKQGVSI